MVFWILLFPNSHKNSKETLDHFWGHERVPFICSNGMKFISDIMQIGGHEWWATQPVVGLLHKKKLEVQVGGRTLSSAGGFWGLWGTNVCVNGHSSHRARLLPSLLNYWSSHWWRWPFLGKNLRLPYLVPHEDRCASEKRRTLLQPAGCHSKGENEFSQTEGSSRV